MNKIDIYNEINNTDVRQEMRIATITKFDGNEFDLKGEKILFKKNGDIIHTDKVGKWFQSIMDNLNVEELFKTQKTLLKNITIDKNTNIEIFIDIVRSIPRLLIFGSGHIARPLARMAQMVDFNVSVIDNRNEFLNKEYFPTIDEFVCKDFTEYLSEAEISSNDYLVIITRGHDHDYEVLKNVIYSNAKYIGMIGSNNKVETNFKDLKREMNVSWEMIEKVKAPIGIKIGSETPAEIAVSIMAELIDVRRK